MGVRSVGSIRRRPESGLLFLDFKYLGSRLREQTALPDTESNRKRLQKALERIEGEIALGSFDYEKTFGKPLPTREPGERTSLSAAAKRRVGLGFTGLGEQLLARLVLGQVATDGDEVDAVGLTDFVDLHDVGMHQRGGGAGCGGAV